MEFLFLFLSVSFVAGSLLVEESSSNGILKYRLKRGVTAERNQFPYHVQLVYTYKIPLIARCNGAIISNIHVVSTANCVVVTPRAVIAGILERDEILSDRQMVEVMNVKINPQYTRLSGIANIALILLDFPLTFNSAVNKIDLPSPSYEAKGNAQQTGWKWQLSSSNNKLQVEEKELTDCPNRKYSPNPLKWYRNKVQSGHVLCAKGGGALSECQKDSGEPLVQDNYLIGLSIADLGKCKVISSVSVYTNVAEYVIWLRDEIMDEESETLLLETN